MPTIPYVKQGAPFIDHASNPDATFAAADANAIDNGVHEAMLQPAVRVTHNAAQSITTATATALAFNTERYDQVAGAASTMHDTATNNSRLTCRYVGIYEIKANVRWASNGTGQRDVGIRLNGTTFIGYENAVANSGSVHIQEVSTQYALAVNDYVECVVTQTSGGGLNIDLAANYSPEFSMVRVA
jgi:hypothetical protein